MPCRSRSPRPEPSQHPDPSRRLLKDAPPVLCSPGAKRPRHQRQLWIRLTAGWKAETPHTPHSSSKINPHCLSSCLFAIGWLEGSEHSVEPWHVCTCFVLNGDEGEEGFGNLSPVEGFSAAESGFHRLKGREHKSTFTNCTVSLRNDAWSAKISWRGRFSTCCNSGAEVLA